MILFSSVEYICNKPGVSSCGAYVIHIMGTLHPSLCTVERIEMFKWHDVVVSLIQDYLCQGYSLHREHFYTSPTLVSDLYDIGVHVTGTLHCTHTCVPAEIPSLKKQMANNL